MEQKARNGPQVTTREVGRVAVHKISIIKKAKV